MPPVAITHAAGVASLFRGSGRGEERMGLGLTEEVKQKDSNGWM